MTPICVQNCFLVESQPAPDFARIENAVEEFHGRQSSCEVGAAHDPLRPCPGELYQWHILGQNFGARCKHHSSGRDCRSSHLLRYSVRCATPAAEHRRRSPARPWRTGFARHRPAESPSISCAPARRLDGSRIHAAADGIRMPRYDLHCHSTLLRRPARPRRRWSPARRRAGRRRPRAHRPRRASTDWPRRRSAATRRRHRARLRLRALGHLGATSRSTSSRLGIDPGNATLDRRGSSRFAAGARTRARRIADGLAAAGIPGAYEGAMKHVTSERLVSRTHFARYLVEAGHARDSEGRVQALPHPRKARLRRRTSGRRLTQAIGWIHAAGGQAVHRASRAATTSTTRRACAGCSPSSAMPAATRSKSLSSSHTAAQCRGVRRARPRPRAAGVVRLRLARPRRELDGPGRPAATCLPASCRCGRTGSTARCRPADARATCTRRMPNRRTVFFVSDRTGITAEMLGNSLLSQFEDFEFQRHDDPVRRLDREDRRRSIEQINETAAAEDRRPIVFSSIVDEAMSDACPAQRERADARPLPGLHRAARDRARAKSSHAAGRSHGIANSHEYFARMDAINFSQSHDDGAATRDLAKAQVILVGVSRCGKTPTSLYLALQFGIRAANFPLTPDDFADRGLPASLLPLQGPAVRPHDQSGAAAQDPRGAAPGQQVLGARQLPLRGARVRAPARARRDSDARHDGEVDRGDRDDDPATAPSCGGTSIDGDQAVPMEQLRCRPVARRRPGQTNTNHVARRPSC